jgi:hypothetical protein
MTPQEELDQIYISIGEGHEMTDELMKEIERLENIVNPRPVERPLHLYKCDCGDCWECAAERGGCPEDV